MASTNLMSLSDAEKKKFLESFDFFISDCDGKLILSFLYMSDLSLTCKLDLVLKIEY